MIADADRRSRAPAPPGRRASRRALTEIAAAAALAVVLFLRFAPSLRAHEPRIDEAAYLAAFEAVHRGESPYVVHGYLYTPSFAAIGGAAREWWSAAALLTFLRAINVVATAALLALSISLLDLTLRWRLAIGAAYGVLAPGVALALRTGNVSPIAGALVVAGLLAWRRSPLGGGVLIGMNLAWKPLGAVIAPLVLLHRPRPETRRQIWAGAAAFVASVAVSLPGISHLPEFLAFGESLPAEDFRVSRTVSLHRLLSSLGLPVDRLAVAVVVGIAALVLVRVRRLDQRELLCFAIAASCLAMPSLWPHTLLMALPIQVLALERAFTREVAAAASTGDSLRDAGARRLRLYERVLVVLGVAALQWSDAVGAVPPEPSLQLALALAPPVLATPLLAWYVMARPRAGR